MQSKLRLLSPLLLLIVFTCAPQVERVHADETYRVLTYNIRYANRADQQDQWDNRKEKVVETIQQADLAGLQEVLAVQQEYIQQNTPGWQWLAVGRDDGHRRGEMCSVGWRTEKFVAVEQGTFWLSPTPFLVGQAGWDAALPRIASWTRLVPRAALVKESDDRQSGSADSQQKSPAASTVAAVPTLLLINTHLDHRGAEARRQSAALLRSWIAGHRRESQVILVGDLNAQLGSPPLNELLSQELSEHPALLDARELSKLPDPGPNSTWNGFREIALGNRIDHVLCLGNQLRIESYQTLDPRTPEGRFASDHLPVLVGIGGLSR